MIQRVQTIYAFCAAILMSIMLFVPIATSDIYEAGAEASQLVKIIPFGGGEGIAASILEVSCVKYLAILVCLSIAASISTIFSYRNRMLQIRQCAVNCVILIGAQLFAIFSLYRSSLFLEETSQSGAFTSAGLGYTLAVAMPIVALFFTYLAMRAVTKDEMLVRSLNRIR